MIAGLIDSRAYSSRRQAILAGLMRGAVLGAKWGAIVGGSLLLYVLAIVVGRGDGKSLAEIAGPTFLGLAFFISIPAVFGALMMGIGNGVYYRSALPQAGNRDGLESVFDDSASKNG